MEADGALSEEDGGSDADDEAGPTVAMRHGRVPNLTFPAPPVRRMTSLSAAAGRREPFFSNDAADTLSSSSPKSPLSASGPPRRLISHPCLHLLSPKADAIAQAAVNVGVDDVVDSALGFGWLLPHIAAGELRSAAPMPGPVPPIIPVAPT